MTTLLFHSTNCTKRTTKKTPVKPLDTRSYRRRFTDSIKLFVTYADIYGSRTPERYYIAFSKLLNVITGIEDRKTATEFQKQFLETCEIAVISGINEGMFNNVGYKQIYKDVRKKLEEIKKLLA